MRRFCKLLLLCLASVAAAGEYLVAARAAGDYLVRATGPDGLFVYRVDLNTGRASNRYNWLRHAGTVYSLCQLHQATGDARYLDAAERAGQRLRAIMEPVLIDGRAFVVPVSRPATTGSRQTVVKTGGCALAVIAFWHLDAATGKDRYEQELLGLGDYLRFVQEPTGLIRSKYDLAAGRFDEWRSAYYPGETLLALALLEARYPLAANRKAMVHLLLALADQWAASNLRAPGSGGFDHWGMLGLAAAYPLLDDAELVPASGGDWDRARLLHEALIYCTSELTLLTPEGYFTRTEGRATPTAIRLEGLQAVRDLCAALGPEHAVKTASWNASIERALAYLGRCQIPPGALPPMAGGLDVSGAFRNGPDPESEVGSRIQIDYSQHAISALLAASKE